MLAEPERAGKFICMSLPHDVADMVDLTIPAKQLSYRVQNADGNDAENVHVFELVSRFEGGQRLLVLLIRMDELEDETPFRVLHYMADVLNADRCDTGWKEMVPGIFPIVLYHGKKRWNVPNVFNGMVMSNSGKDAFGVQLRYQVIDLTTMP